LSVGILDELMLPILLVGWGLDIINTPNKASFSYLRIYYIHQTSITFTSSAHIFFINYQIL